MSKPLNQIELGTACIIKESGQPGTLQRIFHYPTKYLVKTEDGEFQHYNTHEILFDGYERSKTSLSIPEMHKNSQFVEITNAGMTESHVHDVMITKEAPNYQRS